MNKWSKVKLAAWEHLVATRQAWVSADKALDQSCTDENMLTLKKAAQARHQAELMWMELCELDHTGN